MTHPSNTPGKAAALVQWDFSDGWFGDDNAGCALLHVTQKAFLDTCKAKQKPKPTNI